MPPAFRELVRLTENEADVAEHIGRMRREESLRLGFRDAAGATGVEEPAMKKNILGALCEIAFSIFLGVTWAADVNEPSASDVAEYEVRGTTFGKGDMIVRPRDLPKMHRPFVSVGQIGRHEYAVYGWLTGMEARHQEWQRRDHDRPMMWVVPEGCLYPFLPAMADEPRKWLRPSEVESIVIRLNAP